MQYSLSKNKKVCIENNRGFTLIEMLISLFIFMTLLAALSLNFSAQSKQRNLTYAKNIFISDIHKMQSFSLSSKNLPSGAPSTAYGFYITTGACCVYQLVGYNNAATPVQTVLFSHSLPANVYITQIAIQRNDGTNITVNSDTVIFEAPFARIAQTFSGSANATREHNDILTITLASTDPLVPNTNIIVDGITGNIRTQ